MYPFSTRFFSLASPLFFVRTLVQVSRTSCQVVQSLRVAGSAVMLPQATHGPAFSWFVLSTVLFLTLSQRPLLPQRLLSLHSVVSSSVMIPVPSLVFSRCQTGLKRSAIQFQSQKPSPMATASHPLRGLSSYQSSRPAHSSVSLFSSFVCRHDLILFI